MLLFCIVNLYSCEKFLDAKPTNLISHPNSLENLRALLDYEPPIISSFAGHGELASDDFILDYTGLSYLLPYMKDAYLWEDRGIDGGTWRAGYNSISIANVILESLNRIQGGNQKTRDQLRGEALFLRGWMYFNLAQIYCEPYSILKENNDLGLVLRYDSSAEFKAKRSTLNETYQQILEDITNAVDLLPNIAEYKTRSSKLVALAALARIHLFIENYEMAEKCVDQIFIINSDLLDYNTLKINDAIPINLSNNIELLNFAESNTVSYLITHASTVINPVLYDMYEENDLRKLIFYEPNNLGIKFKGFYHGVKTSAFYGLAMDEMYLIKAECLARKNDVTNGALFLNKLLRHRFKSGYFTEKTYIDNSQLLEDVFKERRKELVFRGLRWYDLRRLNRQSNYAIKLIKNVQFPNENKIYVLEPNDKRYTFLIPIEAIDIGGYEQNPR